MAGARMPWLRVLLCGIRADHGYRSSLGPSFPGHPHAGIRHHRPAFSSRTNPVTSQGGCADGRGEIGIVGGLFGDDAGGNGRQLAAVVGGVAE